MSQLLNLISFLQVGPFITSLLPWVIGSWALWLSIDLAHENQHIPSSYPLAPILGTIDNACRGHSSLWQITYIEGQVTRSFQYQPAFYRFLSCSVCSYTSSFPTHPVLSSSNSCHICTNAEIFRSLQHLLALRLAYAFLVWHHFSPKYSYTNNKHINLTKKSA